jgi:hypothetical protein
MKAEKARELEGERERGSEQDRSNQLFEGIWSPIPDDLRPVSGNVEYPRVRVFQTEARR